MAPPAGGVFVVCAGGKAVFMGVECCQVMIWWHCGLYPVEGPIYNCNFEFKL